ncbi:bifunctional 4-hydroxy-2-oxoglutarate aldolase/2-dehydro-3-deoxy-phosphogluconate aldolase [Arthrobacter sp. UYCu723]
MSIFARIGQIRIVPVIEIDRADQAVRLAEALTEGGLPIMEITLRTEAGLDAISAIAEALPDFLVGAGSLLTPDQVKEAALRGAKFGVSPGHSRLLIDSANEAGLPFVPGAVTASEFISALESGQKHLKFFPAEAFGGVKTIRALVAPFATAGIKIMPTGGVNPGNIKDYLSIPEVLAVGGSWIATRQQIEDGEFDYIAQTAREAAALVSANH